MRRIRPAWSKIFGRPNLKEWLGTVVYACHPRYVGRMNRRIVIQINPITKRDPKLKITTTERASRVTLVVECLPGMHKTLEFNMPVPPKTNKN
jgi:hypothetical protein